MYFKVSLAVAVVLILAASFIVPVILKKRKKHKQKDEFDVDQWLNKKFTLFSKLSRPILVTWKGGEAAWCNEALTNIVGAGIKHKKIHRFFDSIDDIGKNKYEMIFQNHVFEANKDVFNIGKIHFSVYSMDEIKLQSQRPGSPLSFDGDQNSISLRRTVEDSLIKKSYLFQLVGMGVELRFEGDTALDGYSKPIATAIENILTVVYLLAKEKEEVGKHIEVSCRVNNDAKRCYMNFKVPGLVLSPEDLQNNKYIINQEEKTIASVFRKHELSLSALRCRTIIKRVKGNAGKIDTMIELAFNVEESGISKIRPAQENLI